MRPIQVLQSVGYVSGAIALLACLAFAAHKRKPSLEAWLISLAFAVSFLMDTVMLQLAHFNLNNWWVAYIGYPIQFGILLVAVLRHRPLRIAALTFLGLVAVASVFRDTMDRPETFVRVSAGAAVSFLIWGVPEFRPYRAAVWLYCAVEIPLILAMGGFSFTDPRWLWAWVVYQVIRIGAAILLVVAIRKEVPHGGSHPLYKRRSPVGGEHGAWIPRLGRNANVGVHPVRHVAQAAKR